jgi:hypothetical protein
MPRRDKPCSRTMRRACGVGEEEVHGVLGAATEEGTCLLDQAIVTVYPEVVSARVPVANTASYAISSSLILVILNNMIIGTNLIALACPCRHF